MTNHMQGRFNPLTELSESEVNSRLEAIVRQFGLTWLNAGNGTSPVQRIWKREDGLSTDELFIFGDACLKFEKSDAGWLKSCVKTIKHNEERTRYGTIFEMIALSMYKGGGNDTRPMGNGQKGYDGTITLPDKSKILFSLKNHGISTNENLFRIDAAKAERFFREAVIRHRLNGLQCALVSPTFPTSECWTRVQSNIEFLLQKLSDGAVGPQQVEGQFGVVIRSLSLEYNPLSSGHLSSTFFCAVPMHPNEQKNFEDHLSKACHNISKHAKTYPPDSCPVVFVRLSTSASMSRCEQWVRDYLNEYQTEPFGAVVLYQTAVTVNLSTDESSISHYYRVIPSNMYSDWIAKGNGRSLLGLVAPVGTMAGGSLDSVLVNNNGRLDLSTYYTYQKGDIFRFHDLRSGDFQGSLSNPASGIRVHLVLSDAGGTHILQGKFPPTSDLELLP